MHFSKKPIKKLKSILIDTGATKGLVSIVLPVYNGGEYICEAINSVINQTYENWELIIVDDGSNDQSGIIADEYAKKNSKIRVIHQENQKLPTALNRGFAEAKGEYFTWLSADNRLLPDFLYEMVGELKRKPKADMVFGNQFLIDESGDRISGHGWFEIPPNSGRVCFPPATPMLNIVANNTIGAAFMYRAGTEAVLGGYSPNLFLLEDYDFFMKMNSFFNICHIRNKRPAYEYRFHRNSLTAKDEELGITAGRPRLMELDKYRRNRYTEPIFADFSGVPEYIAKELKKTGFVDKNPEIFISVKKEKNKGLSYRIEEELDGFSVYKNEKKLARIKGVKKLAIFLRFRSLCDLMREFENDFL